MPILNAVTGRLVSPWRGDVLPSGIDLLGDQLFYLDVPNESVPPRGWYIYRINPQTATKAWVRLEPQPIP